jgi:hypothetical protein
LLDTWHADVLQQLPSKPPYSQRLDGDWMVEDSKKGLSLHPLANNKMRLSLCEIELDGGNSVLLGSYIPTHKWLWLTDIPMAYLEWKKSQKILAQLSQIVPGRRAGVLRKSATRQGEQLPRESVARI